MLILETRIMVKFSWWINHYLLDLSLNRYLWWCLWSPLEYIRWSTIRTGSDLLILSKQRKKKKGEIKTIYQQGIIFPVGNYRDLTPIFLTHPCGCITWQTLSPILVGHLSCAFFTYFLNITACSISVIA